MRIFSDYQEMMSEVIRDVKEMGVIVPSHTVQDIDVEGDEQYDTKEVQSYQYAITRVDSPRSVLFLFTNSEVWAGQEFDERVSEEWVNPGLAWTVREHIWREFLEKNGRFSYTYNERLRTQLPRVINELAERPFTRQAVISLWNPTIDVEKLGGSGRVPCSLYYHPMIRPTPGGVLRFDMTYAMRSCDLFTHFGNDVWLATSMMNYLYQQVRHQVSPEIRENLVKGRFIHQIASFHAFRKDWDEMERKYYEWINKPEAEAPLS